MAAIWVLNRPAPTEIPRSWVELILRHALGAPNATCRRTTLSREGVLRLDDFRFETGGLAIEGTVRITPDWRRGVPELGNLPATAARGRITAAATGEVLAEDVLVRVVPLGGSDEISVALRAGEVTARARFSTASSPGQGQGRAAPTWLRTADWSDWTRTLRSLAGGIEILAAERTVLTLALQAKESSAGSLDWSVARVDGTVRLGDGASSGWVRAEGFRQGDWSAGHIEAALDGTHVSILGRDIHRGGLSDIELVGFANLDRGTCLARLESSGSNLALAARLRSDTWRVESASGRIHARELLRVPEAAQSLERASIDVTGAIELGAVELSGETAATARVDGWFAVTGAGWGDIRSSNIRPERPESPLTGSFSVDLARDWLELANLDLAGLQGSIRGGLSSGSPYTIRLASSQGNPVHPPCLDSLLGAWWVDLWRRFDLSTTGTRPQAEVVVRGRWGASAAEDVRVAASLERFGFMGARFLSTQVRVEAHANVTRVWIDELTGELDGQPAGSAKGALLWDWNRPEWQGMPRIEAEGDLHPSCALRLHDADLAAQLRGMVLGAPWTVVRIEPGEGTQVRLVTSEVSQCLGAQLGPMEWDLKLSPDKPTEHRLEGRVALAGGQAELRMSGDLHSHNRIERLVATGIRWGELPKALPMLFDEADAGQSTATLGGQFTGTFDFLLPMQTSGEGSFRLIDPNLRKIHLLGAISRGLDFLGVGFGNYELTEAWGSFALQNQVARVPEVVLEGEDAELRLKGKIELKTGALDLRGNFSLKDSPWGPLAILNPNRLITKVIKIKVGGTIAQPETKVQGGF